MGLLAVPAAMACSCVPNPTPRVALDQADAVFVGKVLQIEAFEADALTSLRVTLWVERPIKGFFVETVTVQTVKGEVGCGFPFEQDQRYLVYAYEYEGILHASLCSRTAHLSRAGSDLAALGITDVEPDDEEENASRGGCGGPSNFAAMQAMLFVFLGVGFMRRRV